MPKVNQMSKNTVFVLHKNGAPNHYEALEFYLKKQGRDLKHREFSVVGSMFKAMVKLNGSLFSKQLVNIGFLISLIFTKRKTLVLGIAPYDKKLLRLLPILKNHRVCYHSSWTSWDGSFQPKNTTSSKVLSGWRFFLENKAAHIFAVSTVAKDQLLANYELSKDKVSVVYHTLRPEFLETSQTERTQDCIYIGRLVPQKGIDQLVNFFSNHQQYSLTIIGDGKLNSQVEEAAQEYDNIRYLGKISEASKLKEILQQHRYLVLNSLKTKKWEELFGIVIIESMSQGVIPISTAHSGPRSIIANDTGYLFNEGDLTRQLEVLLSGPYNVETSKKALAASKFYDIENISQFWAAIDNLN